jgi:hypothetical protein
MTSELPAGCTDQRCCQLSLAHPLWRRVWGAYGRSSEVLRDRELREIVTAYPGMVTVEEIKEHMWHHRPEQPPSSTQSHHRARALNITDAEWELVLGAASMGLISAPAAVDLTSRSLNACQQALNALSKRGPLRAVHLPYGGGQKGDRRRRIAYFLSATGAHLVRSYEEVNDCPDYAFREAAHASNRALHHDAQCVEIMCALLADSRERPLRVLPNASGDGDGIKINVRSENLLGPQQVGVTVLTPIVWRGTRPPSGYVGKQPDGALVLGIRDGDINVGVPLLIEYDSGSRWSNEVADQIMEYGEFNQVDPYPFGQRLPELTELAARGFRTPVLFVCDVQGMSKVSPTTMQSRMTALARKVDERQDQYSEEEIPSVLFCTFPSLMQYGWDTPVTDARNAQAPARPLWMALYEAAQPWRNSWPLTADQTVDLGPRSESGRKLVEHAKTAVNDERTQLLRDLGFATVNATSVPQIEERV